MNDSINYKLFHQFIDKYLQDGFQDINRNDPFIVKMDKTLQERKQFFYVGNMLTLQILYTSKGCTELIGVPPEEFDLSTFITRTHPEDQVRYGLARTKYIKTGHDIFFGSRSNALISTHFRMKGHSNSFIQLLFQGYMFQMPETNNTVYTMLVLTDLTAFNIDNDSYHFYFGENMGLFRYPDVELLHTRYHFTSRELEILQLISKGMDSEHIASKLHLSPHTVNTHRRNILKKTDQTSTQDLVIELLDKGIL